jgi:hypothetical protein
MKIYFCASQCIVNQKIFLTSTGNALLRRLVRTGVLEGRNESRLCAQQPQLEV